MTGSTRSLAPDLARGAMLLLIVLANTPWYLYGSSTAASAAHPDGGSALDRVVQGVIITVADLRVYPMFAFLFGYGIVQLYRRQVAGGMGERDVRRVLRRRHLWLLLFGALHAGLLWFGDILGAYGLVGLIMVAAFLRRRDRTLAVWAIVLGSLLVLGTLLAVVGAVAISRLPADGAEPFNFLALVVSINGIESWPDSVLPRLSFWPFLVLGQGVLGLVVPVAILLAFLAARHQVLERPEEHRRLLTRVAVAGVGIGWVGGLLSALHHLGLLQVPAQSSWVLSVLGASTGLFGGLGYVAAFGLLAIWLRGPRRDAVPVRALTAVGKRSLSSYLAQSLACAPLLAAWGLGLGAVLGSAGVALLGAGVWVVTVVAAMLAERADRRGPAETLLRRLSYGLRSD